MLLSLRSLVENQGSQDAVAVAVGVKARAIEHDALNGQGGGIAWPYPFSVRHWSAPRRIEVSPKIDLPKLPAAVTVSAIARPEGVGATAGIGQIRAKGIKNPTDEELVALIIELAA